MTSTVHARTLVDAHVHLHSCFDPDSFFSDAFANLARVASSLASANWQGVLFLAEPQSTDWWSKFSGGDLATVLSEWHLDHLDEPSSIELHGPDGERLTVIAGQQIVTAECLELLSIGTTKKIPDGTPISEAMAEIERYGALRILPWGNGKWLGRRGQVVDRLLREANPGDFYLGDNSGRLRWTPAPRRFAVGARNGLPLLPGSDPLPFPREERKVGSYGFSIPGVPDRSRPFAWIRDALTAHPDTITPFGQRERLGRFVRNQTTIQIRKWLA